MSIGSVFCGLECVFEDSSDVWKMLHVSDMIKDHYYFAVVDAAVWSNGDVIDIGKKFAPSYFEELIEKEFWAEYLVVHLYPEMAEVVTIDYYADYLKSECEMIILLYDVAYLEIYCKNPEWLQKLYEIAISIPGNRVTKKFEDDDARYIMYV